MSGARMMLALALGLASTAALAVGQDGAKQAAPAAAPRPAGMAPAAQPDAVFAAWDRDRNGTLSREEFRAGWAGARTALATGRLKAEFARHDGDRNGAIDGNEYLTLTLVKRAGKSAPLLSAFDRDKNRSLSFEEYLDLVRTATRNRPAGQPAAQPAAQKK